jgi:hypothetical protein
MKLKNLSMSSTKAFALVQDDTSVTSYLQAGWDVRFDYLLIPPLVDPILVKLPGCTILVSNGSTSTVKWPVAGAFSKWNWLEWPITVISNSIVGVDKFSASASLQSGWTYIDKEPLYFAGPEAYYAVGDYNPEEKVGLYWDDWQHNLTHRYDDTVFVRELDISKTNVIRECPSFDLPNRIQLRIALVRVKEN